MYEKRHVYEKRPFQTYVGLFCRSLSYVHITLVCKPLQKRPTHVWKETSIYLKRDLHIYRWKKFSASSRPIHSHVHTYKRDLHISEKRPTNIWKETYNITIQYVDRAWREKRPTKYMKTDLHMFEKRPAYVWKETYDIYTLCVDRAWREKCIDIYKSV